MRLVDVASLLVLSPVVTMILKVPRDSLMPYNGKSWSSKPNAKKSKG